MAPKVPKTTNTEGRRLLVAFLKADPKKRTQTWLAGELDVYQSACWQWLQGVGRPDAQMRQQLEALTGIQLDAWLTPSEKKAVLAARKKGRAA